MNKSTRVFKAGNSLAIRLPSVIAKHCDLEDGTAVEISAEGGVLHVRKAPSPALAALIDRITPENVHEEQFDNFVGAERW